MKMANVDRCAACGAAIPEGRQLCYDCTAKAELDQINYNRISLNNMMLAGKYPTCSLCGYAWLGVAKNPNFCPNCGAKMEDKGST